MPNNRLSHTDQETPMPRDYQGGSDDFGVVRQLDGQLSQDGEELEDRANIHRPNG